jgi:hypothetical protein
MSQAKTAFLSYAREDAAAARRLYDDLRFNGIEVWFDQETPLGGERWKDSAAHAIRNAKYFLALLSSNSVNKIGAVQSELRQALDELKRHPPNQIFVVPIRLDNCIPTHPELQELNWIDLFQNWELGVDRILRVTGRRAALHYPFVTFGIEPNQFSEPRLPIQFRQRRDPDVRCLADFADIVTRPNHSVIPQNRLSKLGFDKHSIVGGLEFDVLLIEPGHRGEYLLEEGVWVDVSQTLMYSILGEDILSKLRVSIDYETESTQVQHQNWDDWTPL